MIFRPDWLEAAHYEITGSEIRRMRRGTVARLTLGHKGGQAILCSAEASCISNYSIKINRIS
jgi:hypothetical protein